MGTSTGELRESLMDAIERVKARKLSPEEGLAIAKIAGQISLSMQVEANLRLTALQQQQPTVRIGAMSIGEETPEADQIEAADDQRAAMQQAPEQEG